MLWLSYLLLFFCINCPLFSGKVHHYDYASDVATVGRKIGQMANQLDVVNKDLESRLGSFKSTLAVVESSWKEKPKPSAALQGVRQSSRNPSSSNTKSKNEKTSPSSSLEKHLNQR